MRSFRYSFAVLAPHVTFAVFGVFFCVLCELIFWPVFGKLRHLLGDESDMDELNCELTRPVGLIWGH